MSASVSTPSTGVEALPSSDGEDGEFEGAAHGDDDDEDTAWYRWRASREASKRAPAPQTREVDVESFDEQFDDIAVGFMDEELEGTVRRR